MNQKYNFRKIRYTFPMIKEGALDTVRESLDRGHTVTIEIIHKQQPLNFINREEFEQWLQLNEW